MALPVTDTNVNQQLIAVFDTLSTISLEISTIRGFLEVADFEAMLNVLAEIANNTASLGSGALPLPVDVTP